MNFRYLYFFFLIILSISSSAQKLPYLDNTLPIEARVQDLLSRMTLEEKALQMDNRTPAIPRLGIPAYDWWNEALHGVARAGLATSFPQPIGLAAGFNKESIFKMGTIVSDEARAKYHQFQREENYGEYTGLTFYSPNINIFRDPRWGRGHETFGEDPYLTSQLGVEFVKSMQGNDPTYLKTITTAKHFAVHSGPEALRHEFDARVSKKDLWNTYLPAFKALAQDAKVHSFMCAYNRVNGEPCCSDSFLLQDILRKKWKFNGFIATDCGAVYDFYMFHKTAKDSIEAVAQAINAGVDNQCYGYAQAIIPAIKLGLLSEKALDTAVSRLMRAKMKMGFFDKGSQHSYFNIPYSIVNNQSHRDYALKMALESTVLLKNNGILPISQESLKRKRVAVIGPNANDKEILLGNYFGEPAEIITPLAGLRKEFPSVTFDFVQTALIDTPNYDSKIDQEAAILASKEADLIIFFGGISPKLEGEDLKVKVPGFEGGDKTDLKLPEVQHQLLKALKATGKPVILVLLNGSAIAVNWENENLDAIVEAWYGGERAGDAIAQVLSGKYNPAGRLPITFYKSIQDLPAFDDYSMQGKTYRYIQKEVLYPFGFGLSYTDFKYKKINFSNLKLSENSFIDVEVTVQNTGKRDGEEVVQLYLSMGRDGFPIKELKAFKRVFIKAGKTEKVVLRLWGKDVQHYQEAIDDLAFSKGKAQIFIGPSSLSIQKSANIVLE